MIKLSIQYKLILNGFTLTCQVSAQKITTKTLNFYIWKQYRSPNGTVINRETLQPHLKSLSREIKQRLSRDSSIKVSPSILHAISAHHLVKKVGVETTYEPQNELSCFRPSYAGIIDTDFVFIKMHHLHPFSMRDQSLMNNGNGENDKENEKDKIKKNVFI